MATKQLTTMGLVLREVKVGEADKIITLFTPQGIISAAAKGSRRLKSKLFSATSLFCYAEFTLFEGKMYTVDEATEKEVFYGIRESVEGMALAMYLAELAMVTTPQGEEAAKQLRLLLNSFWVISRHKMDLAQVKAIYELRMLSMGGYMPALVGCDVCCRYEDAAFYFNAASGKLLCRECAAQRGAQPNLSFSALTAMRHICLVDDEKVFSFTLANDALAQLSIAAENYMLYALDKPLKTLEFYHSCISEP